MNNAIVISFLASSLLQVALFSIVPFVVYLLRKKKGQSFPDYVGLHSSPCRPLLPALALSLLFFAAASMVIYYDTGLFNTIRSPRSVQGQLHLLGPGATSLAALLLVAWLKTSLAEEIFFRGFLGKTLVGAWGFRAGNAVQALLFGAMHSLLFGSLTGASFLSLGFIFLLTSITGWLLGYLTEKKARGSILPAWLVHASVNTVSYYIFSFIV